jgi:hypothetical protein
VSTPSASRPTVVAMGAKRGLQETSGREGVMAELELLASGKHTSQQTVLERYRRCADWKQASVILCRALGHSSTRRQSACCKNTKFRFRKR